MFGSLNLIAVFRNRKERPRLLVREGSRVSNLALCRELHRAHREQQTLTAQASTGPELNSIDRRAVRGQNSFAAVPGSSTTMGWDGSVVSTSARLLSTSASFENLQ